jgi:hypothetical protein
MDPEHWTGSEDGEAYLDGIETGEGIIGRL